MNASISVDPKSGNISVGDFLITAKLKISELPEIFAIDPEQPVSVLGKMVPCQFAATQIVHKGQPLRLELRFENQVLVSCFVTFPGATLDDEHLICSRWLKKQLGFAGDLAPFPWGCAGVARDKSDYSHVFMHNENNTWAR